MGVLPRADPGKDREGDDVLRAGHPAAGCGGSKGRLRVKLKYDVTYEIVFFFFFGM